ncbi:unnamed protein product [Rangifer tarandus platyrhynchus]|uniref:Uncharacterized protein n=1 Tax=Rangifer tarandus platyrhynchus TaxID=3082113 RepID=A0AC59Y7R1_RANTA
MWGPGQHEALFSNGASITILCFRVTSQSSSANIFNWCYQEVNSFRDGLGPSLPAKDPTAREGGGQRPSAWLA